MKYSKILLCMTALAACLLIGIAWGEDYLEGGYVRSSDRSMMDPGIASMLQWLDTPVPTFPWYSSDVSFYKQAVPDTTFSPFTEYYTTTGTPVVGGIISNPTKFNITQKTPSRVYYGAGVGLPYSQYASTVPSKTNDLWIQGATNWTQYVASPVGTWLQLIAYAPVEGPAGFYEMIQTDITGSKYKTYQFNQGYNTMNFNADQMGRHMLYFVVNNQPSNLVIVDVFAQDQNVSITPSSNNVPEETFGFVEGRVYNELNGVGVASAEMTVDYNPTRIMTDALGNYRLKVLPAQHRIGAQSSEYGVIPISVTVFRNQTTKLDLKAVSRQIG